MLRVSTIVKLFGRSKDKFKIDPEDLDEIREKVFEEVITGYQAPDRLHQDMIFEENVYGKTCHIIGLTIDSDMSTTFAQHAIVSLKPTHVILGLYNYQNMARTLIRDQKFQKIMKTNYQNALAAEKMFCKSRVTEPILEIIKENPNYVVRREENDLRSSNVLVMDHQNKRVTTNDYLTIMNLVVERQLCKLSFGAPSDLIVFEDLMLNVELEELREILKNVIDSVRTSQRNCYKFAPVVVMEEIIDQAKNHRKIFQKQLIYASALLNKYCSTSEKPMMFVPRNFVSFIAENVHNTYMNPEKVYNRKIDLANASENVQKLMERYLGSEVNKQKAIDQMLQKFSILSLLKGNSLEVNLIFDKDNVFKRTFFKPLFQKFLIEDLIARYQQIRAPIKKMAGDIVGLRLENIQNSYRDRQKQILTLPEQLKTQQQRIYDFPTNFVAENKNTRKKLKRDLKQLFDKMQQINETQSVEEDKQLMRMHLAGRPSKQSVILADKLMVEAKIRLKKQHLKLPNFHFAALRGIFKQQIKDNLMKEDSFKGVGEKARLDDLLEGARNHPNSDLQEITDPQQIREYLYGEKGQKLPKIRIQVDDSGKIVQDCVLDFDGETSWRDHPNSVTVDEMMNDLDKDPFFSEYKKELENASDDDEWSEDKSQDSEDIENSQEYRTNKYYKEEIQYDQPKSKIKARRPQTNSSSQRKIKSKTNKIARKDQ